jgi:hypothetical protein
MARPRHPAPTRREFLRTSAAAAFAGALGVDAFAAAAAPATANAIKRENARTGDDWQLTRVRLDSARGFRSPLIEGYCSRQSVATGDALEIMVSTSPARAFTLEIFRMGCYGGAGARRVAQLGPFAGRPQPVPPIGEKRLRECRWEPATTLTIPADWLSGVYLGRLTTIPQSATDPYWQSYVIFIVRDRRAADVLFQCSDNTWQAYNRWPDNFSLYTDPRGAHAVDVAASFDRPYGKYAQIFEHPLSIGSGEFLLWEYPLLFWLEQHGYDVTYGANCDSLDLSHIARCKAFLSVGHDEYWDTRQYDAVKKAIDERGVSALWLCGNSVFGVTPFSPSSRGQPNRTLTRAGIFGGLTDEEVRAEIRVFTEAWRRAGPDESLLMGARSIVPFNGGGDWTCALPDHWLFADTGMKRGESIPGLVGWEHHGAPAKLPGLAVVAEGTVWRGGDTPARYTATVHPGPKGNIVFNAATIFWSQGLASPPGHILPWSHWSRPHGPDARVQQITRNALRRALRSG